jgi:hypothetical protein
LCCFLISLCSVLSPGPRLPDEPCLAELALPQESEQTTREQEIQELLANPAIQAAVAPFILALAVAAALRRTRLLGLAVAAAFALVIALTIGYSFETLTSVRKLVLAGLAAALVLLVLAPRAIERPQVVRTVIALAAGAAAVWVLWRILQQQEPEAAALHGFAAAAYLALLVESSLRASAQSIRGAATSLVLGLAAGGLALLGASALLAQFGIAVAAGAGAILLVQVFTRGEAKLPGMLVLPGAVIAGLIGLLAVFTGSLPWFCLIPTLAIPWAALLVPQRGRNPWLAGLLVTLAAAIPMLLALALAWTRAGTST